MQTGGSAGSAYQRGVQTLSSLADLHARGALTDEEFAAAKAQLLRIELDVAVPLPPARPLAPPPPPPASTWGVGLTTPVPRVPPGVEAPDEATALPRLYRRLHSLDGPQHAALVARRAGVPQDEVEVMLTQLIDAGLVHRHPNGLVEMRPGAPMPRGSRPRAQALPRGAAPLAPGDVLVRRVRLGLWALPVLLLGVVGGVVGYLALNRRDPRRARHVLGWGVMVTAIELFLLTVVFAALILTSDTAVLPR